MEPLAVLGLVSNVVQLVDISTKIIFKVREIRANSEVKDYTERHKVTSELRKVSVKLVGYLRISSVDNNLDEDDAALVKLCEGSNEIANRLIERIDRLKVDSHSGLLTITKAAVKQLWAKEDLDSDARRLQEYRSQLNTGILVSLRKKLDILDQNTQSILLGLENNRTLYNTSQETQRHYLTNLISSQHERTRELITTLVTSRFALSDSNPDMSIGNLPKKFWKAFHDRNITAICSIFTEDPAVVFVSNDYGQTALHLAAMAADLEMTECLIKHGAEMSPVDYKHKTPLHYAVQSGSHAVAISLVMMRAQTDAKDAHGLSPRDLSEGGSLIEWMFARRSCNLEERDSNGQTALAFFSEKGDYSAVQTLLDQGADIKTTTTELWTPLCFAASAGHIEVTRLLLEKGANANHCIKAGVPILTICAKLNQTHTTKALLDFGANIDTKDTTEELTALFWASRVGSLNAARVLIQYGADCNQVSSSGEMPIHVAARTGHLQIVRVILECTDNVSARNVETNMTALHEASKHGQTEVAKLLLQHGASTDLLSKEGGHTPLMLAIEHNHIQIVEHMLNHTNANLDVKDENGRTALFLAAAAGKVDALQLLLKAGANVDCQDQLLYTPLCFVCKNCDEDSASILLKAGADVHSATVLGWTALHQVCLYGHLSLTQKLLSHGADPNTMKLVGYPCLNLAAKHGQVDIVRELLESKRVDIDKANGDGWTSLAEASHLGYSEIVRLLLAHGSRVDTRDRRQYTPLLRATDKGHLNTVMLLLDYGADVQAKTYKNLTVLAKASQHGHCDIVRLLLTRKAIVDSRDLCGYTPLNLASKAGHVSAVQQLLEQGADVDAANMDGWTSLAEASSRGHIKTVQILLKYGARRDITNNKGRTPYAIAFRNSQQGVVDLLRSDV